MGSVKNDHMQHLQFQVSPCVACGIGLVDLITGLCDRCNCQGTRFAVPFGCPENAVVWCARERAHELATCEVLPAYVECVGHCEFVDIVLRTLFEERWCHNKVTTRPRFLDDLLKCARGAWCDIQNIDVTKCNVVQHASMKWVVKQHVEFVQCFKTSSTTSIEELASNCIKSLSPYDCQTVYHLHSHDSRVHKNMFASEKIFPLSALDVAANILVFYKDTHVRLQVNMSSAACVARLRADPVAFECLSNMNHKMCCDMHNEIWRRLHDDTKVDQSVLIMVEQCVHMCCNDDERSVYEAYAICFDGISKAYANGCGVGCGMEYAFVRFQDGVFKPVISTIFDYVYSCIKVAFSYVCDCTADTLSRALSIKNVETICTSTLNGVLFDALCDAEDKFFTRIARKNWYNRVLDPGIYKAIEDGRILFTGASHSHMQKLGTYMESQILYTQSKKQRVY